MLHFLYATDLHGNIAKYNAILVKAIEREIKIIHLGADILPKGSPLHILHKKFVTGFLEDYHKRCVDSGIELLLSFGNDDLYPFKKYYREYGKLLDETTFQYGSFNFEAYNYVPIYPFSLRTACKKDSPEWVYEEREVETWDSDEFRFFNIMDPERYFEEKGTIQEDLEKFNGGPNSIFACHSPPAYVGLDVCQDGRTAGSKAVFKWIEKTQPRLVLCGHIHENYTKTKNYRAEIGSSVIIQPGQSSYYMPVVEIRIGDKVESELMLL